jgi:uncharacterized protein (TIGR02145 family)
MKTIKNYLPYGIVPLLLCLLSCSDDKDNSTSSIQVITREATSIAYESAVSGANIFNDAQISIVDKGVLLDIVPDVDWEVSTKISRGSGGTSFECNLTNLTPATQYYVRAYVKTETELYFGTTQSFVTKTIGMALVNTNETSAIQATQATLNGEVTYAGGTPVTERGFVWSTTPNPEMAIHNSISNGSGVGAFSNTIETLEPATQYYYRAYAINQIGVSYGETIQFSTPATLATIQTKPIENIGLYGAMSGGEVINDGGAAITQKGIVWGTQPNPTTSLTTKTLNGAGLSNFTATLTQLTPGTVYHLRAYATNSVGTAYGNAITFSTLEIPTSITDVDGNVYSVIQIGNQFWMQENLRVSKYCNGDAIPMYMADEQWQQLTTGGWSYYDNFSGNESVGKLYNFYAVTDDRNLCPCGWHVPTDAEWTQLENHLIATGMNFDNTTQGNKIAKAMASKTMWQTSSIFGAVGFNPTTNNNSNFNGLPAGRRFNTGEFVNYGSTAAWWTSSQQNSDLSWYRWLSKDGLDSKKNAANKRFGYNIRCIMD